ncbi:MAG: hypothetical protein ACLFR8_07730, partial [Alkalispirochaeta sp.]
MDALKTALGGKLMEKSKWLRGLAIPAGVLVVVIAVLGLVSCADLLGSEDGDSDDDGEEGSDDVTYAIGDEGPAGGRIFYIDETDKHDWTYIEA